MFRVLGIYNFEISMKITFQMFAAQKLLFQQDNIMQTLQLGNAGKVEIE